MNAALRKAKASIRKQGPCAFCGGLYAAHRVIDSEMCMAANGETLESTADWYGKESASEMVLRWIALMELLDDAARRNKSKPPYQGQTQKESDA